LQNTAPQRRHVHRHVHFRARGNRWNGRVFDGCRLERVGGLAAQPEGADGFLQTALGGKPLCESRPGISEVFHQDQVVLGPGGEVFDPDTISKRLAGGAESGQKPGGGKIQPERTAESKTQKQQHQQQGEALIGDHILGVQAHDHGDPQADQYHPSRAGQTPPDPVPQ